MSSSVVLPAIVSCAMSGQTTQVTHQFPNFVSIKCICLSISVFSCGLYDATLTSLDPLAVQG